MTAFVPLKGLLQLAQTSLLFLQRCAEVEETEDFNWLDPAWSHQEVWSHPAQSFKMDTHFDRNKHILYC